MDHPYPWLRYVDADDVNVADIDFNGLEVRNSAMETLGQVDGFIVDRDNMRPYYVVVDSGGWFKSKDFLVPIAHARLDDDRDALVVDIPRERIERFPGFDRDTFDRLSADDARRMNDEMYAVCNDTDIAYAAGESHSTAWDRPDYRQPGWWSETAAINPTVDRPAQDYRSDLTNPASQRRDLDREHARAGATDESPHLGGRAQPGDVLGIETAGERTFIGDTDEDENERRSDAVKRRK